MFVCQSCGVTLPEGASFCPNCGVALDEKNVGEAPKPLEPTERPVPETDASDPLAEVPEKKKKWRPNVAYILLMIPVLVFAAFAVLIIVALNAEPVSEVEEKAELFHQGLVPVLMGDGNAEPLWGYVDKDGREVIEPRFDAALAFADNDLAAVSYLGSWGFINKSGEFVVEPIFEEARNFGENRCASVKINGSWGYIDEQGRMFINPQFDSAENFAENGLALVGIGDKYGYINRKGVYVIPPQFDNARSFGINGNAAVFAFGKWGIINKNGEYVINPQFDTLYPFANNDLALVEMDGTYGYINRSGAYVIQPMFEEAHSFGENGLALVKLNGKYGYINGSCEFAIEAKFDHARPFIGNTGIAAVCPDKEAGLWGYINYNGEYILEPVYLSAGSFSIGIAAVQDEEGLAYIDEDGKVLHRPDEACVSITPYAADRYAVLVYVDEKGNATYDIIDDEGIAISEQRFYGISLPTGQKNPIT